MDKEELKICYAKAKERYNRLLSKYRGIYKECYPEEFDLLKKMSKNGDLPKYTYEERCTPPTFFDPPKELERFQKNFDPAKRHWAHLPANFYDPIYLRRDDPDFIDKFNYYNWSDRDDRNRPHFDFKPNAEKFMSQFASLVDFLRGFQWIENDFKTYRSGVFEGCYEEPIDDLDRYVDSRTVKFDHEDIIITDPGYVVKDDDWHRSEYGHAMTNLGSFTEDKYATSDTIYGDWSCTTFDTDTKQEIGDFCADAGLVSVFSLAQVKAYDPEYNPLERPWCVTLIKDFTGEVTLKVKFNEKWGEFERYVEGKGSVNFIGTQSGL